MTEKRFHCGLSKNDTFALVISTTPEKYNKLAGDVQAVHRLVEIRVGGAMSPQLAEHYARQICDQLNQFDAANLAVAKLT